MIGHYQDVLAIEQADHPNHTLNSTYQLLQHSAQQYADAPALSFFLNTDDHHKPQTWSYKDLFSDITRAANLFRRLGIQRDDVVALILPNLPETHIAMWGAETAGIAFAVNNQLESSQLAQLLRNADVRWVVTVDAGVDEEMWTRTANACAALPGLHGILCISAEHYGLPRQSGDRSALPERMPVLNFHDLVAAEPGDELLFEAPAADDIAAYFCTGGTTGLPKIACHSQRNQVIFAGQLNAVVGGSMLGHGRTVLTALPLFHVNALLGTGLAAFASGSHVLLATAAGFRTPGLVPRFWEIVATHKVNGFSGVPTIYSALLQVPADDWDTSSLSAAICGAAPMPAELIRRFEQQFGMRVLEGYGLTEGVCASSVSPVNGALRPGSIGMRLPWQDMRAMVLDDDGRWLRDAATDETGVICISGPNVFAGYLDDGHNHGVWFETPDGQRWFNTGDLGRCDDEGFFWLTGRKKELIIRGGHNIDPRSIEDALVAHPAVAMCAAVGRPDIYAGELPVAYVQLRPGHDVSHDELLGHARSLIAERPALPKELIFVDALPLTAVGKTFKPALVMREVEQVVRQSAQALGVQLQSVDVRQEAKHGVVVRYRCAGDNGEQTGKLAELLASYTFVSQAL